MKKKNPWKAFLWLLLIPAQLAAAFLFISLGSLIDTRLLFQGAEEAQGHGMPVFTLLFTAAAVILTIAAVIFALIMTVKTYRSAGKQKKENTDLW